MRYPIKQILSFTLASVLSISSIQAEVVFRDDFTRYAPGSAPGNPRDGNEYYWNIGDPIEAKIAEADGKRFLQLRKPHTGKYATVSRKFSRSGNRLTMKGQIRLNSEPGDSDYFLFLSNSEESKFSGPVKIRIANQTLMVYHTEGKISTMPDRLEPGVWYTIRVEADLESQQYSVTISSDLRTEPHLVVKNVGFNESATSLDTFLIRPVESRELQKDALDWGLADLTIEWNG